MKDVFSYSIQDINFSLGFFMQLYLEVIYSETDHTFLVY